MVFNVNKKSGFKSFDPVVKIYDGNGILFYLKDNNTGLIHFNLPRGRYNTVNTLYNASVRTYKANKLPKPNRKKKLPKSIKIVYKENPHKCSVDNVNHIIYFDNSFKKQPIPVKDYIKFHEVGHYFYSGEGNVSEIACDLFAANMMLKVGYNPSQIQWAQHGTLSNSETSLERKGEVKKLVNKTF